ncbi:LpxL/LpxP family acyltransferase [Pinibacter aurantiacus]|uniref:Lipid A biosynthesis acyltransferase n=1 Tax=Pinibacter aurantiacus TaxID=2851599 RepID=A0A9E2W2U9_9BACT|nr:lipid A biosynthesis acyltransferase [Pinibacter aurantiacus]MBV4356179.1 lipid A biosynthesis acyltransferase [Pinibacter aurantiacus]
MSSWQGRSKGTPLGYRIFISILKNFGVVPAYLLLRFVAGYYFLFDRKSSKILRSYFRDHLHFSKWKTIGMMYKNYYVFGQGIIDKVVMMANVENQFTFDFDGEENLRSITALGKGGLLLSAHLGNWEIAGHLLKRLETRINIVMYDGEHEKIKQYLEGVTGKRNMNVIVIKDDISHIYAINEALRNNELVCMHADRFVDGNKTVSHEFLGEEARFPLGPFILASTFKVPVSFVYAFKETNKHYHLFSSEPKRYGHLTKGEVVPALLKDYVEEMERKTKLYPAQWFNYYDFWKA